mgnify:CR=1 FL=1
MAKSISRYLADISSTSGVLDGTLSTAAQTNITSLGTLSSLTVSGAMNGTLSTAAQPNITSLGTLTALTVDNIGINGETITLTGGSATGFIQTSTNVMQAGTSTSDPLILYTDNTAALTIDTSQNATFAGTIATGGNITANSLFAAKTSSGIGNTGLEVFSTGQTYITRAGGPLALNNTSGVGGQIYLYAGGTYTANISTVSGGISFGTGAGGSVTDNRMTLDGSGNLAVTGTIATGGITINGAGSTISDSSDLGIVSGGTLTMDITGELIIDTDLQGLSLIHI